MHAYRPAAAPAGFLAVWFDLQLLHFVSKLQLEQPRFAVQSFVSTLLQQHAANGCSVISQGGQLKPDTLRKLVSAALSQYRLLEHQRLEAVRCAAQGGSSGEAAKQPDCPACGLEPHSLYADCNMRETHLRGAGSATTREPQIQQRLVPDAATKAFMDSPANSISGPLQEPCNDFDADAALARSSTKNDITGARLLG